jgi:hypothetical protein
MNSISYHQPWHSDIQLQIQFVLSFLSYNHVSHTWTVIKSCTESKILALVEFLSRERARKTITFFHKPLWQYMIQILWILRFWTECMPWSQYMCWDICTFITSCIGSKTLELLEFVSCTLMYCDTWQYIVRVLPMLRF